VRFVHVAELNELKFDENLAIREVLEDIIGMVDRRERLIQSASDEAERSGDEQMARHVAQLERLMSEFLALFDPVLIKVKGYGETLRESIVDSEKYLGSLVGIIDAGKSVEGTSATLQELEKDADAVQEELELSGEVLSKIEDLFQRTKRYARPVSPGPAELDREAPVMPREIPKRDLRVTRARPLGTYAIPGSRLFPNKPAKSQH